MSLLLQVSHFQGSSGVAAACTAHSFVQQVKKGLVSDSSDLAMQDSHVLFSFNKG